MKKIFTLLTLVICSIALTCNGQILNPGFENWTSGDPDNWASSNAFPAGLVNVTQSSDSHSGSSAVQGEVVNFMGTPIGPVIQSGTLATGFTISERYQTFELYYKFTSVGGDKFSVNVAFENGGNTIAQGIAALPTTVSSYTHLAVPMNYTTSDVPDLAIIQISITGPVTGIDLHVGSVMLVDDLSFSFSTGIDNNSNIVLTPKCYPNPSVDIINFPLNESVSGNVAVTVFDIYGKEVKEVIANTTQNGTNNLHFSVASLSPGLYVYSIKGQDKIFKGKFTVGR